MNGKLKGTFLELVLCKRKDELFWNVTFVERYSVLKGFRTLFRDTPWKADGTWCRFQFYPSYFSQTLIFWMGLFQLSLNGVVSAFTEWGCFSFH